jgi:hypothetical protein
VLCAALVQYSACPSCTGSTVISSILCSTLLGSLTRYSAAYVSVCYCEHCCLSASLLTLNPPIIPPRAGAESQPASQRSQHSTTTTTRPVNPLLPLQRHARHAPPRCHVSPPATSILPVAALAHSSINPPAPYTASNQHRTISGSPLPRIPIPCRFRPSHRQGPRSPSHCHHHLRRLCRYPIQAVDVGTSLAQPEEEDQRHTHLKPHHNYQASSTPTRTPHPDALTSNKRPLEYTAFATLRPPASVAPIDSTLSQTSESVLGRLRAGGSKAK